MKKSVNVLFLLGYMEVSNMKEHKLEFYQSRYESLKAWSESKGYSKAFEWYFPSVEVFASVWCRYLAVIAKIKRNESPMERRMRDLRLFSRTMEIYGDNETSR